MQLFIVHYRPHCIIVSYSPEYGWSSRKFISTKIKAFECFIFHQIWNTLLVIQFGAPFRYLFAFNPGVISQRSKCDLSVFSSWQQSRFIAFFTSFLVLHTRAYFAKISCAFHVPFTCVLCVLSTCHSPFFDAVYTFSYTHVSSRWLSDSIRGCVPTSEGLSVTQNFGWCKIDGNSEFWALLPLPCHIIVPALTLSAFAHP